MIEPHKHRHQGKQFFANGKEKIKRDEFTSLSTKKK